MENKCIYCGTNHELSKSDIIPDALTNAKIINPNVCRIEHNNKFSDLFESEIIEKLAMVTNELDIKSSKSKKYALYNTRITVEGIEYKTKISSEPELLDKIIPSTDGKHLMGPPNKIKRIKNANENNVTIIDVNKLDIKKTVSFDLSVFFSDSMYRLVAKIAFEWYCLHNDVNDKLKAFEPIIQFITKGQGENIVTIVGNKELYNLIGDNTNFASHTLICYLGQDNSVNVLVSLYGIAIYNVKICDTTIVECKNNVIFQELTLDAYRYFFKSTTLSEFQVEFLSKFYVIRFPGVEAMIPKDMSDLSLKYQLLYISNYPTLQGDLQSEYDPSEKTQKLILNQLEEILQSGALTLRGLKRFVKENFKSFENELVLNPYGTNKKSILMFYFLYLIGQSNGSINNINDLVDILKEKISGLTDELIITDQLSSKLLQEIISLSDYSSIIIKGAKAVESWKYN